MVTPIEYLQNSVFNVLNNEVILAVIWAMIISELFTGSTFRFRKFHHDGNKLSYQII